MTNLPEIEGVRWIQLAVPVSEELIDLYGEEQLFRAMADRAVGPFLEGDLTPLGEPEGGHQ